ncbi:SDR family NAD(P)-dependent oxidoreductase [Pseudonocardia xishanensis]|uniref:SDR family NAD(P)-dependent oxidoreductase n=1 Tax=Pseudonocardia xishanensis TaxID=630995 RepID=A0ABP8RY15_9PSEU
MSEVTTQRADEDAVSGIDPAELAVALKVLAQVDALDPEHPDAVAVRRATARVWKSVKARRRSDRRRAVSEADAAVFAATATAAPGRIDDETAGIPLASAAAGAVAGTLLRARSCYMCKQRYTVVDAFHHNLCPSCATSNRSHRDARADLTGRRALLTGGRAKIGMYIALRLLRDGAHTTITTRFPHDAVRRFSAVPDSADWLHRLRVVGLDLRDPAQVAALADDVAAQGPLDVLINNAAQTVRRAAGSYAALVEAEQEPLPADTVPEVLVFSHASDAHPAALAGAVPALGAVVATEEGSAVGVPSAADPAGVPIAGTPAERLAALAMTARSASPERIAAGLAVDAGGLLPDTATVNSWVANVEGVDPLELLEVQLCNQTAPFILISRLRAMLAAGAARAASQRSYVVNVSAMEGVFGRGYKAPGHPHTNMAKAALNMLTRTSAQEMFDEDRILMTAVDTGWITDERPHHTKLRLAEEGFHAPLDLADGAARVYDPVVRGERGEDLYGVFLKDFHVSSW